MFNFSLLFRTVKYLRLKQIIYQFKIRLIKPDFRLLSPPEKERKSFLVSPIAKPLSYCSGHFTFLNIESYFNSWSDLSNGMLWCYNLNYMDWLGQEGMSEVEGVKWIDDFISSITVNKTGLDPYPIALRSINWVKFFSKYPESATEEREKFLYSQLVFLGKKMEYHLLGNHLLEDAYSLYICASYFNDTILLEKAERLLIKELNEQILPDGAHYEQSPMYHCILLDRLLDCINIRPVDFLSYTASKMLGHLETIVWKDGTIPMLNDSANGIAPSSLQLFAYARQLGLKWEALPLKECGFRRFLSDHFDIVLDVGNITASYQPGHSHADTLNYELRIDGVPVVVDTGISTYEKNGRRQYERGTLAHNTVMVGGKDSSEIWGGFRVGRRATVKILEEFSNKVVAEHNGYAKSCRRSFSIDKSFFSVDDYYNGIAISRVFLAQDCLLQRLSDSFVLITPMATITIDNAINVKLEKAKASCEFNKFYDVTVAAISFKNHLHYKISIE